MKHKKLNQLYNRAVGVAPPPIENPTKQETWEMMNAPLYDPENDLIDLIKYAIAYYGTDDPKPDNAVRIFADDELMGKNINEIIDELNDDAAIPLIVIRKITKFTDITIHHVARMYHVRYGKIIYQASEGVEDWKKANLK